MKDVRIVLLSAFGLGFMKPAPGTWGSLPPPIIAGVMVLADASPTAINVTMAALFAVSCVVCVGFGSFAERALGQKDPRNVVVDEVAGQSMLLMALPWLINDAGGTRAGGIGVWQNLLLCAAAFVLFRVFDIIKPPPVRNMEVLPKGWGVLVDDLVAAVYGVVVLQVLARAVL